MKPTTWPHLNWVSSAKCHIKSAAGRWGGGVRRGTTTSGRLSRGAAQDAALNEQVGGRRRTLLRGDCHNVMPVSRCSKEFLADSPSANTDNNRCKDGALGAPRTAAEPCLFTVLHNYYPLVGVERGGAREPPLLAVTGAHRFPALTF